MFGAGGESPHAEPAAVEEKSKAREEAKYQTVTAKVFGSLSGLYNSYIRPADTKTKK